MTDEKKTAIMNKIDNIALRWSRMNLTTEYALAEIKKLIGGEEK